jgi:hypothetical protein
MPTILCEGGLDSGRDRWFGPPMDQAQSESLRATRLQDAVRECARKHWLGLCFTSRSIPIACNAGTITTSRNAHPVCSTDQSAHSPFALAQCSVVIGDSKQITVLVSTWMSEADRGQRTWVLDFGWSAEQAVCITSAHSASSFVEILV